MTANVSDDALGMREFGSSNKSSIQVPPFTGVLEEVFPVLGGPHAPNTRSNPTKQEKVLKRERNPGCLSIVSSMIP
jgi:hypothetical protein